MNLFTLFVELLKISAMIECMKTERLGKVIKLKRKGINLTMRELASRVGVDRTYISKIESQNLTPAYHVLLKLEAALGADLQQLYYKQKGVEDATVISPTGEPVAIDLKLTSTNNDATEPYDITIDLGSGSTIGIDIKIKGTTPLSHENVTSAIENALLKTFPNAVKVNNLQPVLKPTSKANLKARRKIKDAAAADHPVAK